MPAATRRVGSPKSAVESWHLEFLRGVEFQNFTNAAKAAKVVTGINKKINKKFFKVMIDAAHCGDSDLSIAENEKVIKDLAKKDALGIFHASAKTTRGCLSTDDGWIGALLAAYAPTGKLKHVFVELFHHQDPALAPLRKAVKGHGVDTTDGRTYNRTVTDGVIEVVAPSEQLGRPQTDQVNPARAEFGSVGFPIRVSTREEPSRAERQTGTEPPVGGSPGARLGIPRSENGGNPQ